MDLAAIRAELAGYAPAGWTGYDRVPAVPALPALVVDLPALVTPETSDLFRLRVPVMLLVPNPYTAEAEAALMASALTVAAAYRGITGPAFRSCTWETIDQIQPLTIAVGQNRELAVLSARINLLLIT